jgi:hypothetical protein
MHTRQRPELHFGKKPNNANDVFKIMQTGIISLFLMYTYLKHATPPGVKYMDSYTSTSAPL